MRSPILLANRSLPQAQIALVVAVGATVVVAAGAVAPGYLTSVGIVVIPLGFTAFLALVALFLVPVHILPTVALVIFALFPARILPQEGALAALPVATVVLGLWAFRRLLLLHPPFAQHPLESRSNVGGGTRADGATPIASLSALSIGARICGISFVVWSIVVTLRSVEMQTSTGWLLSFTAGAILPLLISDARQEAALIRKSWIVLGTVFGFYAIGEAILGSNPVWGQLYAVLGVTDSQHWSVYRAEASFGHPLIAALFFAVTGVLAIAQWLTSPSRWPLVAAIVSGLALIATVSRGPLLATAIVIGMAYLAVISLRGYKRWSRVALLAVLGAAGVAALVTNGAFQERNSSMEAALSSQARDVGVWVAIQAANASDWLGTGPGTSGITGRLFDSVVIENSVLQLLISVGIPGVILFLGMIGCAALQALRCRAIAPAAALTVFLACITSFNAIDALRPLHLLLGCLLILALNSTNPPETRVRPKTGRRNSFSSKTLQDLPMTHQTIDSA